MTWITVTRSTGSPLTLQATTIAFEPQHLGDNDAPGCLIYRDGVAGAVTVLESYNQLRRLVDLPRAP